MGSTGTGSFTDYPGSNGGINNDLPNQCDRAIPNIALDEVARCNYYIDNNTTPSIGTEIRLNNHLYGGRLVVETITGEIIGLLPTRLNYLLGCIQQGFSYNGQVISTSNVPIPSIIIDLGPA